MVVQEYDRILVAIDGSKEAELAFKKAVAIVLRNKGSLVITHIVDTRFIRVFPNIENPGNDQQFMDQTVEIARSTLDAYETWARSKGVEKVETILEYGSPRTVISRDIPEEYNIDLILLGATGLNAVERVFIGSVSEYVVRNADCDVLIVRTPLDEDNDEEIISSDSGRDL